MDPDVMSLFSSQERRRLASQDEIFSGDEFVCPPLEMSLSVLTGRASYSFVLHLGHFAS